MNETYENHVMEIMKFEVTDIFAATETPSGDVDSGWGTNSDQNYGS